MDPRTKKRVRRDQRDHCIAKVKIVLLLLLLALVLALGVSPLIWPDIGPWIWDSFKQEDQSHTSAD